MHGPRSPTITTGFLVALSASSEGYAYPWSIIAGLGKKKLERDGNFCQFDRRCFPLDHMSVSYVISGSNG